MSGDSRISILQKDGIDVDMDVHTDMSNNTPSEPTDFPDKMTDSNDQDLDEWELAEPIKLQIPKKQDPLVIAESKPMNPIPSVPLSQPIPQDLPSKVRILKRSSGSATSTTPTSSISSPASAPTKMLQRTNSNNTKPALVSPVPEPTVTPTPTAIPLSEEDVKKIAEREAEYERVRQRIFAENKAKNDSNNGIIESKKHTISTESIDEQPEQPIPTTNPRKKATYANEATNDEDFKRIPRRQMGRGMGMIYPPPPPPPFMIPGGFIPPPPPPPPPPFFNGQYPPPPPPPPPPPFIIGPNGVPIPFFPPPPPPPLGTSSMAFPSLPSASGRGRGGQNNHHANGYWNRGRGRGRGSSN